MEAKNKVIEFRGRILEGVAELDFWLGYYISMYFCGTDNDKKTNEMHNVLLGDDFVSFYSKIKVFKHVAENYDKVVYDQYHSLRTQKKNSKNSMHSDLIFVMENRNTFAHRIAAHGWLIPNSVKPLADGSIRFAKLKNTIVEALDYSENEINELCEVIFELQKHLNRLIMERMAF